MSKLSPSWLARKNTSPGSKRIEGQGRRQPRTANMIVDLLGNFAPSNMPATGADPAMRVILGHVHRNLWQLDDLVSARLRVVGARRARQVVSGRKGGRCWFIRYGSLGNGAWCAFQQ
jgi:hypothetical protein